MIESGRAIESVRSGRRVRPVGPSGPSGRAVESVRPGRRVRPVGPSSSSGRAVESVRSGRRVRPVGASSPSGRAVKSVRSGRRIRPEMPPRQDYDAALGNKLNFAVLHTSRSAQLEFALCTRLLTSFRPFVRSPFAFSFFHEPFLLSITAKDKLKAR